MTPIPPNHHLELERVRPPRRLTFIPHAPYRCQLEPWKTLAGTVQECGVPLSGVEGPQPVLLLGYTIGVSEMGD